MTKFQNKKSVFHSPCYSEILSCVQSHCFEAWGMVILRILMYSSNDTLNSFMKDFFTIIPSFKVTF